MPPRRWSGVTEALDADEPDPGFDLLEGTERIAWRRPMAIGLVLLGLVVTVWAFTLLVATTGAVVPAQSPVPLAHPLGVFAAFAVALALVYTGGILLGRTAPMR